MRDFMRGLFKFLGAVLVLALIVGGVLYAFFVKVVMVGHNAMAPTIMAGDRVLVWRDTSYDLGDVILCPHPSEAGRFVMGRVVGKPGKTVEVDSDGSLTIDGRRPDRDLHSPISFLDAETGRTETMEWGDESLLDHDYRYFRRQARATPVQRPLRIQRGLYLLSDNRTYAGEDSRTFGTVNAQSCIGEVFLRLTAAPSPDEIGNKALDILD